MTIIIMKTSVKILLLIVFAIGAVAGVLVFAKTQVAPPSDVELVDQYTLDLDNEVASFNNISDFAQSRAEYIRLDDKLKRAVLESVIGNNASDNYRKSIVATYGNNLGSYGIGLFRKSVWSDNQINEMLEMINDLDAEKLSTGEKAVSPAFEKTATEINGIMSDYTAALRLSRNTTFKSIADAKEKIEKARKYRDHLYLRYNAALVKALDELPGKISKSHLAYVQSFVDKLNRYCFVSEETFEELYNNADRVIEEYKNTNIYGGSKSSIKKIEDTVNEYLGAAASYYYQEK